MSMTVDELVAKLREYPGETNVVLGFDWGDPVVDDTYLQLETPTLNITNEAATQAHRDKQIAANAEGAGTPHSDDSVTAVWGCKIGEADRSALPEGADGPMRKAVQAAYLKLTGSSPAFVFSGWGAELTPAEEQVVNEAAKHAAGE